MSKVIEFRLNSDKPVRLEVPSNAVFTGVRVKENFPHLVALIPNVPGINKFVEVRSTIANAEFGEIGQEFTYVGNFSIMRRVAKDAPPEDVCIHILYRDMRNEEVLNATSSESGNGIILS